MKLRCLFFCIVVLLLSSCGGNYIRWGKDVFYQTKTCSDFRWLQDKYIRSVRVYDQLTTLALFDVLWISPEVLCAYNKEQYSENQVCAHDQEISFYVLAAMPHAYDALLTDIASPWTLYLSINGNCLQPTSLKLVDVPYAYQVFLGKYYSAAKKAYYVTFSLEKEDCFDAVNSFSLCFHTPTRADECVTWDVTPEGDAYPVSKFNPDILAVDMHRTAGQV